MSITNKEQYPLLCEDCSEEERFPETRRFRPVYRGRAKSCIKGASAIITHWPEHWCSALTYWWLGLGMMMITVFILYNSLAAFSLFPAAQDVKPFDAELPFNWKKAKMLTVNQLPEIYLHFLTNSTEELDINKYFSYLKVIADKNLDYNFNIVVIYNDTTNLSHEHSAEENNEIALNSLWSKIPYDRTKSLLRGNIKINHVMLSKHMELSPITTEWRRIPKNIIELYLKVLSIWDVGGIAINPEILIPRAPEAIYFDKFYDLLAKFRLRKKDNLSEQKVKKSEFQNKVVKDSKHKKNVNNIRDIIENLEHDDNNPYSLENLTEAENKNDVLYVGRKLLSNIPLTTKNKTNVDAIRFSDESKMKEHKENQEPVSQHKETGTIEIFSQKLSNLRENATKLRPMPFFLEFLFHDNVNFVQSKEHNVDVDNYIKRRKHVISSEKNVINTNPSTSHNDSKIKQTSVQYEPMIIPGKHLVHKHDVETAKQNKTEPNENTLTIDLKGNIIATQASCHAFIGSLFSNALHHTHEETVQDFIITELSIFCKGVLSSCSGINLILL